MNELLKRLGFKGSNPVLVCPICWAAVYLSCAPEHQVWHEKLRRAVDETEMLG